MYPVCTRDHEVRFLWQVYAPLTLPGKEINERVLYILGCTSPNCGLDPASWCTIRFQKDVSQEEAAAVDQTESEGDSSAMLSDCPTIPSKVLHVHGYGGRNLQPVVTRQMSKVGEMKTLGVGMLQMVTMSPIQLVFRSSNLH
jgi:hypothetical protein